METAALAVLVREFIAEHGVPSGFNSVDWIAERTRDSDPTNRGISRRRIVNLLREERAVTELSVADALLIAIGKVEALYDGTLEVVASPTRPGCCASYEAALQNDLLDEFERAPTVHQPLHVVPV